MVNYEIRRNSRKISRVLTIMVELLFCQANNIDYKINQVTSDKNGRHVILDAVIEDT